MALDGNHRDALEQIEACIVWEEVNGQLGNRPNALRVKGDILAQGPSADQGEAELCYTRAMGAAQRQGARSWELRAANSLSDLWARQGRWAEAHDMLAPIYEQVTEGRDTCDLIRARAMLDL
jgi:predicted ATPase